MSKTKAAKKVLVLGAGGMLGHVLFRWLAEKSDFDAYGTCLSKAEIPKSFSKHLTARVRCGINAENIDKLTKAIVAVSPDFVINCIALIKPAQIAQNPLSAININARLPHQLALVCQKIKAKLVQISSDIVFDGKKGMYKEEDKPNISDFYGMTKFLGEVSYPDCVTMRTSIIGHEAAGKNGLVEWFLAQDVKVSGYTRVIYSGFPTVELARIISDYVLPNRNLAGIYHISSQPISKYDLLRLIAQRYGKKITVEPCGGLVLDRSLDSGVFRSLTGYDPPPWEELVKKMYIDYNEHTVKI